MPVLFALPGLTVALPGLTVPRKVRKACVRMG